MKFHKKKDFWWEHQINGESMGKEISIYIYLSYIIKQKVISTKIEHNSKFHLIAIASKLSSKAVNAGDVVWR